MKLREKSPSCSGCNTPLDTDALWTIYLCLDEWPAALIISAVVHALSQWMHLSTAELATFMCVGLVPALISIERSTLCARCDGERPDGQPIPIYTREDR